MGRPGHPGDPRRVRRRHAAGKNLEARAYWNEYINRAAAANGVKTFYWDNGAQPGSNDAFALFNRSTGAIVDQAVLDAILLGSGVGDPTSTYTFTTAVNGSGTVSRTPTGNPLQGGTSVTLTATPAAGNQFAGLDRRCERADQPHHHQDARQHDA